MYMYICIYIIYMNLHIYMYGSQCPPPPPPILILKNPPSLLCKAIFKTFSHATDTPAWLQLVAVRC